MSEDVQLNVNVLPETKKRVKEMARMTFRGTGDLIDWLVAEAWLKMKSEQSANLQAAETLDETIERKR